jgi:fumarylacetoacetase
VNDGFGLGNLPFGVVSPGGCAVRFEDRAILLAPLEDRLGVPSGTFSGPVLNPFLSLGRATWSRVRSRLPELLDGGVALDDVEPRMPVAIGDYVDFYSSIEHASNVGRIFRPDAEPLLPNWRHLPVGYHGRASTVVVSGTPVRRPVGQLGPGRFGPCEKLDVELELGFITGPSSAPASPDCIFGFVLVNDWSARDIQAWENRPLGPFLSKSFATSISPWIVPLDALGPFRVRGPAQDPAPLPYLRVDGHWALDIALEIALVVGDVETVISRTNAKTLYWNAAQQLAHASLNVPPRAGDLYASGTISGGSPGSLLELSWNGRDPIALACGETRTFLEDGDEVILRGRAGPVSLGEVRGTITPS